MESEGDPAGYSERTFALRNPPPVSPFAGDHEKARDDHQRKSEPPDGDYDRVGTRESNERSRNRDSEE
jgi:hypothetical protein